MSKYTTKQWKYKETHPSDIKPNGWWGLVQMKTLRWRKKRENSKTQAISKKKNLVTANSIS